MCYFMIEKMRLRSHVFPSCVRMCVRTHIHACISKPCIARRTVHNQFFQITSDFSHLAGCLVMSTDNLIP